MLQHGVASLALGAPEYFVVAIDDNIPIGPPLETEKSRIAANRVAIAGHALES